MCVLFCPQDEQAEFSKDQREWSESEQSSSVMHPYSTHFKNMHVVDILRSANWEVQFAFNSINCWCYRFPFDKREHRPADWNFAFQHTVLNPSSSERACWWLGNFLITFFYGAVSHGNHQLSRSQTKHKNCVRGSLRKWFLENWVIFSQCSKILLNYKMTFNIGPMFSEGSNNNLWHH